MFIIIIVVVYFNTLSSQVHSVHITALRTPSLNCATRVKLSDLLVPNIAESAGKYLVNFAKERTCKLLTL